jgi:hypothetical protein
VSIVQECACKRRIVGGVHAVDASSHIVAIVSNLFPHCSIMVYSLLFKPPSICLLYDLGVEDEF